MKKIEVYIHTCRRNKNDKIDCMCLASDKACEYDCEKQIVLYDEYQDLDECFRNEEHNE